VHLPARIELRLREPEEHHEREGRERRSSGIMRCEKLGPHDCSLRRRPLHGVVERPGSR